MGNSTQATTDDLLAAIKNLTHLVEKQAEAMEVQSLAIHSQQQTISELVSLERERGKLLSEVVESINDLRGLSGA